MDLDSGERVALSATLYADSTVNAQSGALVSNLNALEPIKEAQGNIDNTIVASVLVDGNLGATLIKVGDAIPTGLRFETIVTLTNDHNNKGIPVPGASFLLTDAQINELNVTGHLNLTVPSGYDGLSFVAVDLDSGERVGAERDIAYADSTVNAQSGALVSNLNALEPIKDAQGNIDSHNRGLSTCRRKPGRDVDQSGRRDSDGITLRGDRDVDQRSQRQRDPSPGRVVSAQQRSDR